MNYVAGLLLLVSHNEDVAKHVIHNPVFGVVLVGSFLGLVRLVGR